MFLAATYKSDRSSVKLTLFHTGIVLEHEYLNEPIVLDMAAKLGFVIQWNFDFSNLQGKCVNHLYLPTKRAFKTKRKFEDLRQFWQNKTQCCIDTCVCNFARTLDCISFPLLYQKKVPYTPRFKGTAKFVNVLRKELVKCN